MRKLSYAIVLAGYMIARIHALEFRSDMSVGLLGHDDLHGGEDVELCEGLHIGHRVCKLRQNQLRAPQVDRCHTHRSSSVPACLISGCEAGVSREVISNVNTWRIARKPTRGLPREQRGSCSVSRGGLLWMRQQCFRRQTGSRWAAASCTPSAHHQICASAREMRQGTRCLLTLPVMHLSLFSLAY
jgi:hypothetical protein